MGNQGLRRTRKLCRAQQSSITRSRTPSFHRRIRSFTMRHRLTLLLTCSIRSRRWWSTWLARCCSRVSSAPRGFFVGMRIATSGSVNDRKPKSCNNPLPACQLPTFIHLGGRRSHNAVHGCEVTEMLQTPPQDFRAGVISSTASDKTAQLGNPCDDLGKRGRLCGWLRDTMDGPIEGLPFFWVQQDATGCLGHRTRQHGGIQNPPRQDAVERQTATQARRRLELTCFNAATAFQNPMPDLNTPAARVPLNALDGVLNGLHRHRGQQQPLNRLPFWGRLVFMDLHGPQCHGRQAFSLAVARRTPGASIRQSRPPGFPRGLRATPWYEQDQCTDHGLGLNSCPDRVLRRTNTPIPRGAKQQLNARWALGGQHVIDVGFAVPSADKARLRTTRVGIADSFQAPEPLLTFLLGDGQLLAPGAFAHIVGIPCPDLLRQQPQGHTLRRDRQGTMDKQASARRMSQGAQACGRPQTRPVHLGGVLYG